MRGSPSICLAITSGFQDQKSVMQEGLSEADAAGVATTLLSPLHDSIGFSFHPLHFFFFCRLSRDLKIIGPAGTVQAGWHL